MTVIYTIVLCLLFIVVTVTYMSVAAFESRMKLICSELSELPFTCIFLDKLRIIVRDLGGFCEG